MSVRKPKAVKRCPFCNAKPTVEREWASCAEWHPKIALPINVWNLRCDMEKAIKPLLVTVPKRRRAKR